MFVSMIIPGPKYPGKNMNVYLEPLVDDLVRGWEGRGIRTYVCAPEDLSLLEAFKAGIDLDADGPPPGFIDDYWFAEPDDDEETRGPITDGDTGY